MGVLQELADFSAPHTHSWQVQRETTFTQHLEFNIYLILTTVLQDKDYNSYLTYIETGA